MLYDYKCNKCDKVWEKSYPVDRRDEPCGKPCPCGLNGTVVRLMTAPGLNFEGSVGKITKIGKF